MLVFLCMWSWSQPVTRITVGIVPNSGATAKPQKQACALWALPKPILLIFEYAPSPLHLFLAADTRVGGQL